MFNNKIFNRRNSILAIILVAGFLIRVLSLSEANFGSDELFHVYAALSIINSGEPILPSGFYYSRSLMFTELVAISANIFGMSEFSARIPSVIFGVLTIFLVYLVTKRLFNENGALFAAFLTAFAVIEVVFSRETRMYSMFQFTNLAFLFSFFILITTKAQENNKRWKYFFIEFKNIKCAVNYFALIACVFFAYISIKLQILFLISFAAAILFAYFYFYLLLDKLRKELLVLGIAGIVVLLLLFSFSDLFKGYLEFATKPLSWAEGNASNIKYYRDYLTENFPFLFGLLPISMVFLYPKKKKEIAFLAVCFFIPLIIHSFLPTKADRYIYYILPILFIVQGVIISIVCKHLFQSIKERLSGNNNGMSYAVSIMVLVGSLFFFILSTPWFYQSIKYHKQAFGMHYGVAHFHWQEAMRYVENSGSENDIIFSSLPLYSMYYSNRFSTFYSLNNYDENRAITNSIGIPIDYASGAYIVTNVNELADALTGDSNAWFVVEKHRIDNKKAYSKELQKFILDKFVLVKDLKDILVFRLRD